MYGTTHYLYQHLGSLISVYKQNYVENYYYLLNYVGMTRTDYKRRMEALGIKSPNSYAINLKNDITMGFDLIYVAALASFFKLPTSLLLNYNLKDIEGFNLADYGIFPNMYKERSRYSRYTDIFGVKPKSSTVYSAISKKKAIARSKYSPGVVNILTYLR